MTRNAVPPPMRGATSIRPSCASTILRTMARPRPEPCGLVVKNGLKMRSTSSAGSPGPSSSTVTTTASAACPSTPSPPSSSRLTRWPAIHTCPSPPSASNALVTRLVNSWRSWYWSPCMSGTSSASEVDTTTDPRDTLVSAIVMALWRISPSETRSTCRRIGRTNSSTSSTMALAILASLMMSLRMACASAESGSWRLSSPAITSMPASGFLTSCAIAAAISPSAARRSRSRSRSSICSTRVRSLKKSAAPTTRLRSSRTCDSV